MLTTYIYWGLIKSNTYTCAHSHCILIHTNPLTHTHTNPLTHTYTHTYTHIHTHTHAHAHTHTHTHACTHTFMLPYKESHDFLLWTQREHRDKPHSGDVTVASSDITMETSTCEERARTHVRFLSSGKPNTHALTHTQDAFNVLQCRCRAVMSYISYGLPGKTILLLIGVFLLSLPSCLMIKMRSEVTWPVYNVVLDWSVLQWWGALIGVGWELKCDVRLEWDALVSVWGWFNDIICSLVTDARQPLPLVGGRGWSSGSSTGHGHRCHKR